MRTRSWPVVVPALLAGLFALVLFIGWTALPDAEPYLVLLALLLEAALILGLYAVQLRRHW